MKFEVIAKDFDSPEVQHQRISLADLWSKEAWETYGPPTDTHSGVAEWFNAQGLTNVVDIGCGAGNLGRELDGECVSLDRSLEQLRKAQGKRVLGDATRLPFADERFDGAASLYTLYFFEEPGVVVEEARRVLRSGGWFATCAPSRSDGPELAHVTPPEGNVFMSEDIPEILDAYFTDVQMHPWDFPYFDLPTREVVRDYLYSWYYPQLTLEEAAERAEQVQVPTKLTKRGAWGVGRKR
jgi:SAM-dependent methyltransferase